MHNDGRDPKYNAREKVAENLDALEMDFTYTVEMLCDWTAMSYKFGDTPEEFYNKKKDTMLLHSVTREWVEVLLPIFTTAAKNYNEKMLQEGERDGNNTRNY